MACGCGKKQDLTRWTVVFANGTEKGFPDEESARAYYNEVAMGQSIPPALRAPTP